MSRISRGTPAGDAYLDLKNQAQRTGRTTQELLQLYVLEGFLARLAASDLRDSFVLKGGVLLAAFDTRRPTKDVDLAGMNLVNASLPSSEALPIPGGVTSGTSGRSRGIGSPVGLQTLGPGRADATLAATDCEYRRSGG